MKVFVLLITFLIAFCSIAFAQEEAISVEVDDIQIDVKNVYLSNKGDTATVEFFLISLAKNPRELKLNTFASGVIDTSGKPALYATMQMGKVNIKIADRQNYLHYLLERDEPVLLKIVTPNWKKQWGKPQSAKLTIEDSEEQGKFFEIEIKL